MIETKDTSFPKVCNTSSFADLSFELTETVSYTYSTNCDKKYFKKQINFQEIKNKNILCKLNKILQCL